MGVRDETDGNYNFVDAGVNLRYDKDGNSPAWTQIACVVSSERIDYKGEVTCENADDKCGYEDNWYGDETEGSKGCNNNKHFRY